MFLIWFRVYLKKLNQGMHYSWFPRDIIYNHNYHTEKLLLDVNKLSEISPHT